MSLHDACASRAHRDGDAALDAALDAAEAWDSAPTACAALDIAGALLAASVDAARLRRLLRCASAAAPGPVRLAAAGAAGFGCLASLLLLSAAPSRPGDAPLGAELAYPGASTACDDAACGGARLAALEAAQATAKPPEAVFDGVDGRGGVDVAAAARSGYAAAERDRPRCRSASDGGTAPRRPRAASADARATKARSDALVAAAAAAALRRGEYRWAPSSRPSTAGRRAEARGGRGRWRRGALAAAEEERMGDLEKRAPRRARAGAAAAALLARSRAAARRRDALQAAAFALLRRLLGAAAAAALFGDAWRAAPAAPGLGPGAFRLLLDGDGRDFSLAAAKAAADGFDRLDDAQREVFYAFVTDRVAADGDAAAPRPPALDAARSRSRAARRRAARRVAGQVAAAAVADDGDRGPRRALQGRRRAGRGDAAAVVAAAAPRASGPEAAPARRRGGRRGGDRRPGRSVRGARGRPRAPALRRRARRGAAAPSSRRAAAAAAASRGAPWDSRDDLGGFTDDDSGDDDETGDDTPDVPFVALESAGDEGSGGSTPPLPVAARRDARGPRRRAAAEAAAAGRGPAVAYARGGGAAPCPRAGDGSATARRRPTRPPVRGARGRRLGRGGAPTAATPRPRRRRRRRASAPRTRPRRVLGARGLPRRARAGAADNARRLRRVLARWRDACDAADAAQSAARRRRGLAGARERSDESGKVALLCLREAHGALRRVRAHLAAGDGGRPALLDAADAFYDVLADGARRRGARRPSCRATADALGGLVVEGAARRESHDSADGDGEFGARWQVLGGPDATAERRARWLDSAWFADDLRPPSRARRLGRHGGLARRGPPRGGERRGPRRRARARSRPPPPRRAAPRRWLAPGAARGFKGRAAPAAYDADVVAEALGASLLACARDRARADRARARRRRERRSCDRRGAALALRCEWALLRRRRRRVARAGPRRPLARRGPHGPPRPAALFGDRDADFASTAHADRRAKPAADDGGAGAAAEEDDDETSDDDGASSSSSSPAVVGGASTTTASSVVVTASSVSFAPADASERPRTWRLATLERVAPRRYMLEPVALELYRCNATSVFLALPRRGGGSPARKGDAPHRRLWKLLASLAARKRLPLLGDGPTSFCGLRLEGEPAPLAYGDCRDALKRSQLTEAWRCRRISTFAYVSSLNEVAGRTFQDPAQWPVFPWVLADFDASEAPDLDAPPGADVWRDLAKPMGALGPASRGDAFDERFRTFEDPTGMVPKFMYGSHYSSAGIVLHFLVRCEPFARLAVELQGGKFDVPDRLFFSLAHAWRSATRSMTDVKELVPELFYCPEMLLNHNSCPWARGRPRPATTASGALARRSTTPSQRGPGCADAFVRTHRDALESEAVSETLPGWIDLVFGDAQRALKAATRGNVFYHLTYEGAIDVDGIDDDDEREATRDQIKHFGQTPPQLLTAPHPRRKAARDAARPLFADCPREGPAPDGLSARCYAFVDEAPALAAAAHPACDRRGGAAAAADGPFGEAPGRRKGLGGAGNGDAPRSGRRRGAALAARLLPASAAAGDGDGGGADASPRRRARRAFEDRTVEAWRWSELPDGRGLPFSAKGATRARLALARARRRGRFALLGDGAAATRATRTARAAPRRRRRAAGAARGGHAFGRATVVAADPRAPDARVFVTGGDDGSVWVAEREALYRGLAAAGDGEDDAPPPRDGDECARAAAPAAPDQRGGDADLDPRLAGATATTPARRRRRRSAAPTRSSATRGPSPPSPTRRRSTSP
ncbi:hypothetical protein JL720_1961 [Aureococcus anophagefferens]|nr:hypothetical protein JL720_1961 [Aureococcus anophagefferens]